MAGTLVLAVVVVVLTGYAFQRIRAFLLAQVFLVFAWRWLTGERFDGEPHTDAGWFRAGQVPLTRTKHARPWWYRPRWQRASWRTGGTTLFLLVMWGLFADFWLTVALFLTALTAAAGFTGWQLWQRFTRRRQERTWLYPLHLAAHELAGHPRALPARNWITAELDEAGAVRELRLKLPQDWQADPREEQRLVAIAAARGAIEAPEPSWRKAGPAPMVIIRHGEPAPSFVEYGKDELGEMLADAVERAGPHEIVAGLGKPERGAGRPKIVKASLVTDSPHFAINMGTGGGKSNLAAFWLMQELRRGAIAMVLDNKWHSHPWAYKDEEGNFDYLPNIAYLSSPAQLHAGMVWLGEELERRNKVAMRAVDASGRLRGDVGPRLFVIAEELNYATPKLRDYWAENRERDDPKKSPALTSLGSVAFAGRAVKMHLVLIGQMLTADVTGSRDNSVKENVGVTAIARYGPSSWGTAVGKNVPMPPSPSVMGRVQLVTASGVRETQTPLGDMVLYRKLSTSGILTPCPAGMPRIGHVPVAAQLPAGGPDVPVVLKDSPPVLMPDQLRVILSEAVEQGIVRRSLAALRKASTRDPDFPKPVGQRGLAHEYDPRQLAEWDASGR